MAFVKDEWWFEDDQGRRIGWLWPEDLEAICESIWGPRKWVLGVAGYLGMRRSTIDQWRNGVVPIPKHIAIMVNMMQALRTRDVPLDEPQAPWLPLSLGANGRQPESAEEEALIEKARAAEEAEKKVKKAAKSTGKSKGGRPRKASASASA